jgi:NADH:quinone reductase (non-electrogenic)
VTPELVTPPAVVLGAGYAGLTACHVARRRRRGRLPIVLVDRHPHHILRTELYEVGRLADAGEDLARWAIPLAKLLEGRGVEYREGEVRGIDLAQKTVDVGGEPLAFSQLAICLGSVAAYYHIPGAETNTHQVYRLSAAHRLSKKLIEVMRASSSLPPGRIPRVVVVGGGSTGTEVAADIATTDWTHVAGEGVRPPQVILVTGSVPLLAGLPEALIRHARHLLDRARVVLFEGTNVVRVDSDRVSLEDGTVLPFDVCVWCAGLEAPPVVRNLPVPHGHGGRLKVTPELELPGHAGVFAVGDVIEFEDPETHLLVPGTAQAALAEARVAGANLVARANGTPLEAFRYRERSAIVQVGVGRAAAAVRRWTLWGRPASLLKSLVQKEYAFAARHSREPPGL